MSAFATHLAAAIAVAYDPMVVPVSDRMLSLVEDCPLGAMAMLAGLFFDSVKVTPSAFKYNLRIDLHCVTSFYRIFI